MSDLSSDLSKYTITAPPVYVGCWLLGDGHSLRIWQTRKPRWLTRLMCRWLLEWEWVDSAAAEKEVSDER